MKTLYITEQGSVVKKESRRLTILKDNKIILLCIHAAASISALWIVINHLKN